ncbi:MAG: response regulator [Polyangiales bacterium]
MSGSPPTAATALILHLQHSDDGHPSIDRWLEEAGYVSSPQSAPAAQAWLAQHKPDLIILGQTYPADTAFETCQQLKSDQRTASIPVLQLLAADGAEHPPSLLAADAYLNLPIQGRSLCSTVQLLLKARRVESAHNRATRKWERTFDAMSDAVLVLDAEHRVVDCNRAMDVLFERDEQDTLGRPLAQLVWSKIRELLDTAHTAGTQVRWDTEIATLGRYYRVVAEESFEHEDQPLTVVTVSDVTERKQLEQGYRDTASEIMSAARRKDEFLAMLAHELRNPLNAIVAANQLQDTLGAQDSENVRLRSVIARQSRHLSRLIDDFLDVSRITRGDISLRFEHVDLRTIIERVCEGQRAVLAGRRQRLAIKMPTEPVTVDGDELRLEQSISNLLTNASKYSPEDAAITLTLEEENTNGQRQAVLSLSDNGIGIPADMLQAVFEMFVQVNPSLDRTAGGLGLGLTVVKTVIERHGGRVEAHSEGGGHGAKFVVRLPRSDAAPTPLEAETSHEVVVTSEPLPLEVLLVEDNDDTRELMCTLLESRGHRVICAADGTEGVELATQRQPEVALVDIGLPGMNGYAVARQLRDTARVAAPFLIALTGYGSPEDHQRASDAGFDAHMVKPIDTARLFELLQKIAEQRRPRL